MHHADARFQGVHRTAEIDLGAVYQNFSLIAARLLNDAHAEKDIHQGGFARAVFTNQAENTPFSKGKIDVFQHSVGKISLADSFHTKQRFFCAHGNPFFI